MNYKCIIFDCDGILVDSETISVKVLQEMIGELGFKIDYPTALEKFTGVSMVEILQFIDSSITGDIPENFVPEFRERTFKLFKSDLKPIKGVHSLIEKLDVPFGVASSGPQEKIRLNLSVTGLLDKFEGNIFSSFDIDSWKPNPAIYLHAAAEMGFSPDETIVIEDSEPGVRAAIAGGFRVFAFADQANKRLFEELGAELFYSMDELSSRIELN